MDLRKLLLPVVVRTHRYGFNFILLGSLEEEFSLFTRKNSAPCSLGVTVSIFIKTRILCIVMRVLANVIYNSVHCDP